MQFTFVLPLLSLGHADSDFSKGNTNLESSFNDKTVKLCQTRNFTERVIRYSSFLSAVPYFLRKFPLEPNKHFSEKNYFKDALSLCTL